MFEHPGEPVIPFHIFLKRILHCVAIILPLIALSLGIGMMGYHLTEHMGWLNSFYNASMILSGMGPAQEMQTGEGKLFAGLYALYSGLFVIAIMGIFLAPVFHRVLHKFHNAKK